MCYLPPMLMFIRKPFLDKVLAGTKTLEIRAGEKYRFVRAGDTISFNGRFRYEVVGVEQFDSLNGMLKALRGRYSETGFDSKRQLVAAIKECYPRGVSPWTVVRIAPCR